MHAPIKIASIGPPPEKHADRVVAEMMRMIIEARTARWEKIKHIMMSTEDGNPRAQRKLEAKVREAGGSLMIGCHMTTGKRGNFTLSLLDMGGWDPAANRRTSEWNPHVPGLNLVTAISGQLPGKNLEIPERPWLVIGGLKIKGIGRHCYDSLEIEVFLVTHHALSRLAQRSEVRTVTDLIDSVGALSMAFFERGIEAEVVDGERLKFSLPNNSKAIAVLRLHEDQNGRPVVATILPVEE